MSYSGKDQDFGGQIFNISTYSPVEYPKTNKKKKNRTGSLNHIFLILPIQKVPRPLTQSTNQMPAARWIWHYPS